MAIAQVIKYQGSPDDLVWKYPGEEITLTSQLIVDETYEALLCVNGQAADLFGPGRHTLELPNIPILRRISNLRTGGQNAFPCKVFYVNQVHQMDMLWGTRGAITLNDPLYDILLHVMLHGSLSFSIVDSRKFLVKLVGFRSRYTSAEMMNNFKGLISSHVKDCISKIMINGMLSYFVINANLFETSEAVKERLDKVFDEYGIRIEYFNIETIEVPKDDYEAVTNAKNAVVQAKARRQSRDIEGYTWQEERQMAIAEKFAGNEGNMGAMGGAIGGVMMGGMLGGSVVDIARNALNMNAPANNGTQAAGGNPAASGGFDVTSFLANGGGRQQPVQQPQTVQIQSVQQPAQQPVQQPQPQAAPQQQTGGSFCPECGQPVSAGSKFCNHCGARLQTNPVCPNCGTQLSPGSKFCNECGTKIF